MYTDVYFVRHAESNYNNHSDFLRELTEKGIKDSALVTEFLNDRKINIMFSSPYKRAIDTIKNFANIKGLDIKIIDDFRERKIGNDWIEDFDTFSKNQWEDFSYKLVDGESLEEVQGRNINALISLIKEYEGNNIVVGTHGTALSTIINYYDNRFDYENFKRIKDLMPWIVLFRFSGEDCVKISEFNLFD